MCECLLSWPSPVVLGRFIEHSSNRRLLAPRNLLDLHRLPYSFDVTKALGLLPEVGEWIAKVDHAGTESFSCSVIAIGVGNAETHGRPIARYCVNPAASAAAGENCRQGSISTRARIVAARECK